MYLSITKLSLSLNAYIWRIYLYVSTLGERWDKQISPTRPMFMHLDIHFSFYYFWNVEFIKTWNVYNIYNPMRNCDFRHMTWWIRPSLSSPHSPRSSPFSIERTFTLSLFDRVDPSPSLQPTQEELPTHNRCMNISQNTVDRPISLNL